MPWSSSYSVISAFFWNITEHMIPNHATYLLHSNIFYYLPIKCFSHINVEIIKYIIKTRGPQTAHLKWKLIIMSYMEFKVRGIGWMFLIYLLLIKKVCWSWHFKAPFIIPWPSSSRQKIFELFWSRIISVSFLKFDKNVKKLFKEIEDNPMKST